eukprot:3197398-Amphidinium_carterae.1
MYRVAYRCNCGLSLRHNDHASAGNGKTRYFDQLCQFIPTPSKYALASIFLSLAWLWETFGLQVKCEDIKGHDTAAHGTELKSTEIMGAVSLDQFSAESRDSGVLSWPPVLSPLLGTSHIGGSADELAA